MGSPVVDKVADVCTHVIPGWLRWSVEVRADQPSIVVLTVGDQGRLAVAVDLPNAREMSRADLYDAIRAATITHFRILRSKLREACLELAPEQFDVSDDPDPESVRR
jgi:hypothetical protein